MRRSRVFILLAVLALLAAGLGLWRGGALAELRRRLLGRANVAERLTQYGPTARARLAPAFERHGVPYPPARFVLAAFKQEKELQLSAAGPGQPLTFITSYPILAASGQLGPKLRDGDLQVPEGLYPIESLNPNSQFHLALRVGYPSAADLARASTDGRTALGGDIMIHGDAVSVGCLAMGDVAIEELFVLAADTGWHDGLIVISPVDFRRHPLPPSSPAAPPWVSELYTELKREVEGLPLPAAGAVRPLAP
jgi:hypothetical protein